MTQDGFVSPTELKEGLRALGCGDITDEQVAQMMAAAGAEGKIHKVEPLGPGDQGPQVREVSLTLGESASIISAR